MRNIRNIIIGLIICGGLAACSSSGDPNIPNGQQNPAGRRDLQIVGHRLRPARAGESYVLWFRYTGDTSWYKMTTIKIGYIDIQDNVTNYIHLDSLPRINDLAEAVISLERIVGASPALPIIRGTFQHGDTMIARLDGTALGDFSHLQADLVFTSTLSDPAAYTKEFYLSSYDGAKYKPSLVALPALNAPWRYGLWAVDSNYTPNQLIYYGMFSQASGHDSYLVGDNLSFPGGDGRHPMNIATGSIIVTLEPDLYGNDVSKIGPTAYSLLRFDRRKYLVRDSDYAMTNVSVSGIPTATVMVFKP